MKKIHIGYVLLAVVLFGYWLNRERPEWVGRVFDENGKAL